VEIGTKDCVTFTMVLYSVAADGTGFYAFIITKPLWTW